MKTKLIEIAVSPERVEEWEDFLYSVLPTNTHPVPGDRVLSLAQNAIEKQLRQRPYKRDHARKSREKSKGLKLKGR